MSVCAAHRTDGTACRAFAIHGGRVCVVHGGKARQVKAAAEERMHALVHPAITALQNLIASQDLAAAKYVLDYAGFKAAEKIQSETEMTIRVVNEDQPLALEQHYANGRADS